jgi:class 3 adenylate cyclase
VNVGSRLESQGIRGRVHVSAETWRNVEELFDAEPRSPIHLRGFGPLETYAIVGPRSKDGVVLDQREWLASIRVGATRAVVSGPG